jgi:hypothetical protein
MIIGVKKGGLKGFDLETYNNDAFQQYNEVALMPCRNCGRTFLPDRLEIHLRSCDKAYAKKRVGEGSQLTDELTNYHVSQQSIRDSQNY